MDPFASTQLPQASVPAFVSDPHGVLERRWRWMLAGLAVGLVATVVAWALAPERYLAQATVVVSRQQVSEQIVPPTIQEDALTRIDALAAEVLSRKNIAKLIEEFDLYPEMRDGFAMTEIVDRVRGDVRIAAQQTVGVRRESGATARVYAVGFEAANPEAAAGAANTLATIFVDASIERRTRQHQLTTSFLRRERDDAEKALRSANREIAELKQKYRGLLPTDLQANLARLEMLQSQRQSLALQVAEAEARIVALAGELDSSPDAQLRRRREELAERRASFTESHPDVVSLLAEIEGIEAQLAESEASGEPASPSSLRRASEVQLAALREQIVDNQAELEALDEQIEQMPLVQEELGAQEERAAVLRDSYVEFMRKLQNAELSSELLSAQQGERVSVLNQAEPPVHPIRSPLLVVAGGLVVALALAVGVAVGLELLDPVLVSIKEIDRLSGVPNLGSVGRIA